MGSINQHATGELKIRIGHNMSWRRQGKFSRRREWNVEYRIGAGTRHMRGISGYSNLETSE
jgi:hypothetical protein